MYFLLVFSTLVAVVLSAPFSNIQIKASSAVTKQVHGPHARGHFGAGDAFIPPLSRNAIRDRNMRWPNGVVPFVIQNSLPHLVYNNIRRAMAEMEHDVNGGPQGRCIRFVPRTTEDNYVSIFKGIGCHSEIGMVNRGRQEISIGEGCEVKGIIMHELIHTLGFWHEQNRYDRDNYINIDLNNVRAEERKDFLKVPDSVINTFGTPYDFSSIMHYGPYTMAKDPSRPVITPKSGLAKGVKLGQRLNLSDLDVLKIQKLYGCIEDTSHIVKETGTNQVVDCSFDYGICKLRLSNNSAIQWTRQSGRSLHGPHAGNTNGADAYMIAKSSDSTGVAQFETLSYDKGSVCIDFFMFQRGPKSYLNLVASGSRLNTQIFKSFRGHYNNAWHHVRIDLNVPTGADFKVIFEAVLAQGDVAIDDLNIYSGICL